MTASIILAASGKPLFDLKFSCNDNDNDKGMFIMNYISDKAVVQTCKMGDNIKIHEFVVIRQDVIIGNNVIIHPNVVIESGVTIGDNVEIFPGTYIGKVPKGAGALARKPEYDSFVNIGENCSLGPNAVIFYDVIIGSNTLLGDGASVREKCRIGSYCILSRYVTINYNTQIGDRTKIMDNTHITGNCYIGNDVFVSLCVGTTNDNLAGKSGYNADLIVGPYIEDGAVIGVGASILPNVRIGKDAIVGAGSVVTKDIPSKSVVMGIPAKVIKYVGEV